MRYFHFAIKQFNFHFIFIFDFCFFVSNRQVDMFLGIPFAKPPVGDLRFKHPEQMEAWDPKIWNATKKPNCCYQSRDSVFDFHKDFTGEAMFTAHKIWNPVTDNSEDCLYLNIWVPRTNPPYINKAVMVWIYGGGFYTGSSDLPLYDGKVLAAENDVIVVSFNYRVGSLGFLKLNTADVPGNAGMMDQRMALEWVQRNIGYFGGSPRNVTIFGESAGAVSVGLHLLSPLSRRLFTRAILQSGAPQTNWATYTVEEGRRRSRELAKNINCNTNDEWTDQEIFECMKKVCKTKLHFFFCFFNES